MSKRAAATGQDAPPAVRQCCHDLAGRRLAPQRASRSEIHGRPGTLAAQSHQRRRSEAPQRVSSHKSRMCRRVGHCSHAAPRAQQCGPKRCGILYEMHHHADADPGRRAPLSSWQPTPPQIKPPWDQQTTCCDPVPPPCSTAHWEPARPSNRMCQPGGPCGTCAARHWHYSRTNLATEARPRRRRRSGRPAAAPLLLSVRGRAPPWPP